LTISLCNKDLSLITYSLLHFSKSFGP